MGGWRKRDAVFILTFPLNLLAVVKEAEKWWREAALGEATVSQRQQDRPSASLSSGGIWELCSASSADTFDLQRTK